MPSVFRFSSCNQDDQNLLICLWGNMSVLLMLFSFFIVSCIYIKRKARFILFCFVYAHPNKISHNFQRSILKLAGRYMHTCVCVILHISRMSASLKCLIKVNSSGQLTSFFPIRKKRGRGVGGWRAGGLQNHRNMFQHENKQGIAKSWIDKKKCLIWVPLSMKFSLNVHDRDMTTANTLEPKHASFSPSLHTVVEKN